MATAFRPFHLKLPKFPLIHVQNAVQIVDYCTKISWTQGLIDTPTSWGLLLGREVTRRGKRTVYTVWIQPFPLRPKKLFNTREAAHELLTAVLFAVTWIMGRQAWHMYPSCSVHWVMQAEMLHIYHVFFLLSQGFPPLPSFSTSPSLPNVNRHRCGQEWSDLFCWWHHTQKGGPERHHLHFPWFQRPNVGSPSDMWQQHGHQSGDLYTSARQLLTLPVCAHGAGHCTTFCPPPPSIPSVCPPMTHHWYAVLYNSIYNSIYI